MSEHKAKKRGRPPKATQPVQTTDIEGIRDELPQPPADQAVTETVHDGAFYVDGVRVEPITYPSKPDNTQALQTLLKAVYRDGALGNKRSLSKDIETLKGLL